MKTYLKEFAEQEIEKAQTLQDEIVEIFTGDERTIELQDLLGEAKEQWRSIANSAGVSIPTLAFVGPLKAGKTWLARQFITKSETWNPLPPSGAHHSTSKLHWVGPQRPSPLDEAREEYAYCSRDEMVDLGAEYQILDTPGAGDVVAANQSLAKSALASAKVKILVLWAGELRAEAWRDDFISFADGSVVLPIVNKCKRHSEAERLTEVTIRNFHADLEAAMPHAKICDPIYLDDWDEKGSDGDAVRKANNERLFAALRKILREPQVIASGNKEQLELAIRRFGETRKTTVNAMLGNLREPVKDFETAERELPQKILNHLLGNDTQIQALLRKEFGKKVLEDIPFFAFPFRSLAGLLILTIGAWDSLIISAIGSIPSLILAGRKSFANIKKMGEATQALQTDFKAKVDPIVRDAVRKPLDRISCVLSRRNGVPLPAQGFDDFDIGGIECVDVTWKSEIATAVQKYKMWGIGVCGVALLATGVFWFLFGAPLIDLYARYIPQAREAWSGHWDMKILDALGVYLQLPPSFLVMGLVFSIIPTFIIALFLVAWALRHKRIRRAQHHLENVMRAKLDNDELRLRVDIRDRKIDALRNLTRGFDEAAQKS